MNRIILLLALMIWGLSLSAQKNSAEIIKENELFRKEMNHHYKKKKTSPLTKEDRKKFKAIPFFDIDTNYYVVAQFERAQDARPFKMKTSGTKEPIYKVFGTVSFKIAGEPQTLQVYQNQGFLQSEEYKDYLFLPFTDLTNEESTYGGGRYIDLRIPAGETITIDFNQAYNPYCAYSTGYNCPIPPIENDMNIAIKAGVVYKADY